MSETITLEVPDQLVERARVVAAQTHRSLEEVILEWLAQLAAEVPIEELPDAEVLTLCDLQMDETEQVELSELLARQRESAVSDEERGRLDTLMWSYRRLMVRKAQALKVATDEQWPARLT